MSRLDTGTPAKTRSPSGTADEAVGRAYTRFQHVLVCLDRSDAAESALPLAAHLARMDGARLTLLHVLSTPPDELGIRATDAIEWDIARQQARSYLDQLAERVTAPGVLAESRIAEGSAPHRVAALAAELEVDLIVLSTYGKSGVEAWSLGSTAQKILALARGAILIVPARARQPAPHVPPRRIFVPLDGSLRGELALPTALRIARADDAAIIVAHVVCDPIRTEVLSTDEDLTLANELADRLATRARAYLEQLCRRFASGPLQARAAVCRSVDHREGLVSLAAAERADLIVLSAHGSACNSRRPFGSVTSHFIASSSVPVLVIQDLPERPVRRVDALPMRLPPRASDDAVAREN